MVHVVVDRSSESAVPLTAFFFSPTSARQGSYPMPREAVPGRLQGLQGACLTHVTLYIKSNVATFMISISLLFQVIFKLLTHVLVVNTMM